MAMVTVFRASISRSLPTSFPNLLSSSSNRNSIPKKHRLLCHAASSQTKLNRSEVSFCIGTHLIPHPKKVERGGEDAFFVSDYNGGVIAVADGVSGWAEQNVDPSLFPRELMVNASCLVGDEEVNYDPQILIRKAHAATSAVGSATVRVEVMEGDTIVMGSDGLFDNVFDHEIVSTVAGHSDVAAAAKALANLASIHSTNSEFESPYSLEARSKGFDVPFWKKVLGMKLTGKTYKDGFFFLNTTSDQVLCLAGGKLDDVTVIVGQVVRSQHISLLAEDQAVEAHTEQENKLES
ncbi:probable protein phosphatase 2C 26 isoform X3 [Populus alba]|uniref:probable protein phosphatase 2C 26 isoform X3 n=1 Tax=Populus alba TaxID=43335 RepID=UPI003CC76BD2